MSETRTNADSRFPSIPGPPPSHAAVDPLATSLDSQGFVAVDIHCRKCGYNVRGLRHTGLCPECATPVGISLTGDMLRYSNPEWVATIKRGISIVLWMILVGIVVGIIGAILTNFSGGAVIVAQMLSLGVNALSLYGVWLFTSPDPSGIGEDRDVNARKIVRFVLIAELAIGALHFAGQAVLQFNPALASMFNSEAWMIAAVVYGLSIALLGAVGDFFQYRYYEIITLRIPDARMAGRAVFLRWSYVICLTVTGVGSAMVSVAALLSPGGPPAMLDSSLFIVGIVSASVGGIGAAIIALFTLIYLFRLNSALGKQVVLAQEVWRQMPGYAS
jgi:hypothetical protein